MIECMQNQADEKQTLGKIKNWKEIVIQGSSLKKITIMELLNINCKCYNYWENKRKGVYMCVLGKMYGYKEVKSSLS